MNRPTFVVLKIRTTSVWINASFLLDFITPLTALYCQAVSAETTDYTYIEVKGLIQNYDYVLHGHLGVLPPWRVKHMSYKRNAHNYIYFNAAQP